MPSEPGFPRKFNNKKLEERVDELGATAEGIPVSGPYFMKAALGLTELERRSSSRWAWASLFIAIFASFLSAYLAVRWQAQQLHDQAINNLNIINCINLSTSNELINVQNEYTANWNPRYITNYYDTVWVDILQEFGPTTNLYAGAVLNMENINTELDRIDREQPSGTERQQAFNEVSDGVAGTLQDFNKLGISSSFCNNILPSAPSIQAKKYSPLSFPQSTISQFPE
jgi:hypothetical protein